ncbi:protein of unknown function [Methylorubrum extorquens]|uniref:Uncharacterized protein n=1 Tax=Methylorubrum extorquens TaxID=408 RepID=A0A2N9AUB2_METEX|nr:protein of unknown function [Methylorubrum extorquens]
MAHSTTTGVRTPNPLQYSEFIRIGAEDDDGLSHAKSCILGWGPRVSRRHHELRNPTS